jgi:glutamine---fructose-6-phosphate transaminase (isomerizing)
MSESGSVTFDEIVSQPEVWDHAASVGRSRGNLVLGQGRGLIIGCGTSAFVAEVLARHREAAGIGETDFAFASEAKLERRYDVVIAITRSATTTEVVDAMRLVESGTHRIGLTAVAAPGNSALADVTDELLVLDFADERSVVQTRFPTAQIALVRAAFGDPTDFRALATEALSAPLPDVDRFHHFVYLASGSAMGLAHEAALKIREMAQAWSESHVALDYRHGPISVAGEHSLIQLFGKPPARLVDELRSTGATVLTDDLDPLGQLVVAQRIALAACEHKGLNPDQPHRLTRSVVLNH